MKINMNIKRKFKISGKEYDSIEEMPDAIRETFKKAMASQTAAGYEIPTRTQTKIIFNGTEYESIDAMPQDVRELYDKVMKAAETGASPQINISGAVGASLTKQRSSESSHLEDERKPTRAEPSFSRRALIISIVVVALILLFYYLMQSR